MKEDKLLQASRHVAVVAGLGRRVWRSRWIEEIPGGDLTTPQQFEGCAVSGRQDKVDSQAPL